MFSCEKATNHQFVIKISREKGHSHNYTPIKWDVWKTCAWGAPVVMSVRAIKHWNKRNQVWAFFSGSTLTWILLLVNFHPKTCIDILHKFIQHHNLTHLDASACMFSHRTMYRHIAQIHPTSSASLSQFSVSDRLWTAMHAHRFVGTCA